MLNNDEITTWLALSKTRGSDEDGPGLNAPDTWISPTYHYFCMAIPKAACSKTKLVLQQLEGLQIPPDPLRIHYRDTPGMRFVPSIADFSIAEGVEILTSPDWFRFAFVRNPYERLFSAYKSQVLDLTSPYIGFRESIRRHAGYPTSSTDAVGRVGFADFVRCIAQQPDEQRDGHWKSQASTLCLDAIRYDFIGQVENYSEDMAKVLQRYRAPPALIAALGERVNTTTQMPLAVAYCKELADLVYAIYREDFEKFECRQDSWMYV